MKRKIMAAALPVIAAVLLGGGVASAHVFNGFNGGFDADDFYRPFNTFNAPFFYAPTVPFLNTFNTPFVNTFNTPFFDRDDVFHRGDWR